MPDFASPTFDADRLRELEIVGQQLHQRRIANLRDELRTLGVLANAEATAVTSDMVRPHLERALHYLDLIEAVPA